VPQKAIAQDGGRYNGKGKDNTNHSEINGLGEQ
jgi:hypothetical protein